MFKQVIDIITVFLLEGCYRLCSMTWRLKELGLPKESNLLKVRLFAHWHGDEILLLKTSIDKKMAVLSSRSRDGERMKRLLERFGFMVLRGSSSRGGVGGLKGLIDVMLKNSWQSASLAVDGPRGPIYQVKPGILKLAQETGLPIIAGASAASSRFVFKKAWNQVYFPLPFAKCVVVYGKPIEVPKGISEEEFERIRVSLQNELLSIKEKAESFFLRTFSNKLPGYSAVG